MIECGVLTRIKQLRKRGNKFKFDNYMLTQGFCDGLEYKIGEAFENSNDERVKGFWCDGVLLPQYEDEYSKKTVNDKRRIITTAYIGKKGQERYELTIYFGKKALSRYARGLDVFECLPDPANDNWFEIDIDKKTIAIQLE